MTKEESKFLVSLGEAISGRRKDLNISQVEMAKKVGIARTHLYRIEKGSNPTTIITLRRIAKELRTNLADIIIVE